MADGTIRFVKQFAALTLLWLALLPLGSAPTAAADQPQHLWQALRTGEAFAIMRHALAPGTGDPASFTLGDCSTQRNLKDEGRRQAMETGDRFRRNGIDSAAVFTSQWCRCRDTADLLRLGPVEELPPLNSFFGSFERREPQTEALKAWLAAYRGDGPLMLVTHQVNITALTGEYTRSGEIVVVRREADGTMTVLGSL